MAKVNCWLYFFFFLITIVVCNMKCRNPILAYGYVVAEFSFKMVCLYLEQVAAPNMALKVLNMVMQVHGGAGLSSDTVLAHLWATARTLRLQMVQMKSTWVPLASWNCKELGFKGFEL